MKFFVFLFSLYGCSLFIGEKGPKTAKGSDYFIEFQKADWNSKNDNRSDYVFENSKDGRILLSNSFCNEFQEQPLENLALKGFSGVKDIVVIQNEYITFKNREAFKIEASGFVDGVKVYLRLLNTRRDNCYFDFMEITPFSYHKNDSLFQQFLDSVVFK